MDIQAQWTHLPVEEYIMAPYRPPTPSSSSHCLPLGRNARLAALQEDEDSGPRRAYLYSNSAQLADLITPVRLPTPTYTRYLRKQHG